MGFHMFTFESDYLTSPIIYTENCSLLRTRIGMSFDKVFFSKNPNVNILADILVVEISQEDFIKQICPQFTNTCFRTVLFTSTPLDSFDHFIYNKYQYSWVFMENEKTLYHGCKLENGFVNREDSNSTTIDCSSAEVSDIFSSSFNLPLTDDLATRQSQRTHYTGNKCNKYSTNDAIIHIKDCILKSERSVGRAQEVTINKIPNCLLLTTNTSPAMLKEEKAEKYLIGVYKNLLNQHLWTFMFQYKLIKCLTFPARVLAHYNHTSKKSCNIVVAERKLFLEHIPEIRSIINAEGVPWYCTKNMYKRSVVSENVEVVNNMKKFKSIQAHEYGKNWHNFNTMHGSIHILKSIHHPNIIPTMMSKESYLNGFKPTNENFLSSHKSKKNVKFWSNYEKQPFLDSSANLDIFKVEIHDETPDFTYNQSHSNHESGLCSIFNSNEILLSFLSEEGSKIKALPRHNPLDLSDESSHRENDSFDNFDDSACSLIMQTGFCAHSESNLLYGINRISARVNIARYSGSKRKSYLPIKHKKPILKNMPRLN